MFDPSDDRLASDQAFEATTSCQKVCLALEADYLRPTGKVEVLVDMYVEKIVAQASASDEIAQAASVSDERCASTRMLESRRCFVWA